MWFLQVKIIGMLKCEDSQKHDQPCRLDALHISFCKQATWSRLCWSPVEGLSRRQGRFSTHLLHSTGCRPSTVLYSKTNMCESGFGTMPSSVNQSIRSHLCETLYPGPSCQKSSDSALPCTDWSDRPHQTAAALIALCSAADPCLPLPLLT